MNRGEGSTNRRNGARHRLDAEVVLVTPGELGPSVVSGRTVDASVGGCRVALDEPLQGATPPGVLLVRTPVGEMSMLTAPVTSEGAASLELGLRFVQPTEPDTAWQDFVSGLPPCG